MKTNADYHFLYVFQFLTLNIRNKSHYHTKIKLEHPRVK